MSSTLPSEKPAPLPWIIQFLAAMMILSSVMGLCEMAYKILFLGLFTFDIGSLIYLPLGHFLLRRNETSRKITHALLVITQCFFAIGFVLMIYFFFILGPTRFFQESGPPTTSSFLLGILYFLLFITIAILTFILILYLLRILRRPEVIAMFTTDPKPEGTDKWTSVLVVLGLVLSVSYCGMNYKYRQLVNRIVNYHAEIHPIDSETKEPVSAGVGLSESSSTYERNLGFQPINNFAWCEDGICVSGKNIAPIEMELTAEGYEPKTIRIEPDTPKYTVKMKRVKTTEHAEHTENP